MAVSILPPYPKHPLTRLTIRNIIKIEPKIKNHENHTKKISLIKNNGLLLGMAQGPPVGPHIGPAQMGPGGKKTIALQDFIDFITKSSKNQ